MNLERWGKYKYAGGVVIVIIAILVYKFRFLSLPYYWDEAWPYSTGVHMLYNHGLSLLPNAVPAFVARGHPLMFHFLAAGWMKLFGTGFYAGHGYALFISVALIAAVFLFCKAFFNERAGLIACVLLAFQPVYIAQSAFLMPEVMMALWTMLCFYAYFKERMLLFVAFAAAMLLTKESGGVLIIALGFAEIINHLGMKDRSWVSLFRKMGLIALPVGIAAIFFVIQKIESGFFLYPFYMNYMSSQWMKMTSDLPSAIAYLFIYDGRNGFSFFMLLAIVLLSYTRRLKFEARQKRIMLAMSLFIVLYLLFSSVNYYIPRYLMCCFSPFIVIGTVLAERAFNIKKVLLPLITTGLVATSLFFYLQVKRNGDKDYSGAVKVDREAVHYCEQEHLNERYILAPSVLRIDFTEPYAGYLTAQPFTHIESLLSDKTEYFIQTYEEDENEVTQQVQKQCKLVLLKKISIGPEWCEIYKVVR